MELALGALWVLLGLSFCLYIRVQTARAVGPVRHEVRSQRRLRAAHLALLVLALPALVALDPPRRSLAGVCLAGAAAIVWLRPGAEDSVWGRDGVRRGWFARRFEDLEEWRLTGKHLRWRLYGVWQATEVPPAEHEALREHLERVAGDRESRFRH